MYASSTGFHGIDMETGFVRLIHAPNPVPRGGTSPLLSPDHDLNLVRMTALA